MPVGEVYRILEEKNRELKRKEAREKELIRLLGRWNDYYRYFQSKEKRYRRQLQKKRRELEQARSEGTGESVASPELEQLRHSLDRTKEALHEKEEMIVELHRRLREQERRTDQIEREWRIQEKKLHQQLTENETEMEKLLTLKEAEYARDAEEEKIKELYDRRMKKEVKQREEKLRRAEKAQGQLSSEKDEHGGEAVKRDGVEVSRDREWKRAIPGGAGGMISTAD